MQRRLTIWGDVACAGTTCHERLNDFPSILIEPDNLILTPLMNVLAATDLGATVRQTDNAQ